MYEITPDITKDYILTRVSQEEIFSRYLCEVEFNTQLLSPLRADRSPTCSFYIDPKGRIILKDWGGDFHGDCFAGVMRKFGIGYYPALEMIAKDFGIIKSNNRSPVIPIYPEGKEYKAQSSAFIQIKRQPWTELDKVFWRSYGLNGKVLALYNVFSIEAAWLNGQQIYNYRDNDPCYAYCFGNGKFKLYFPLRKKHRFITNCDKSIIQGLEQLPESGDFIIITKSLKDVMVLNTFGIPAIAPQAESILVIEDVMSLINARFGAKLSLFDFDLAGIKGARRLRKEYNIQPLFLTNGRFYSHNYKAKDIAAYTKNNGPEATRELIKDIYNKLVI